MMQGLPILMAVNSIALTIAKKSARRKPCRAKYCNNASISFEIQVNPKTTPVPMKSQS
jgi:hypothetical protein